MTFMEKRVKRVGIVFVEGSSATNGKRLWCVYAGKARVGRVSIERISPSTGYVDILISVKHRGRGIGSAAFRKACEESGYAKVIAEVRKSNTASIKALRNAGFRESGETKSKQLVFAWKGIK